jgi:predicted permease
MEVAHRFVPLFLDLILPLIVGYTLRSQAWATEKFFGTLMTVGILFLFPFLTAFSIWGLVPVFDLIWLPFLGILLHIIPGGMAWFWGNRRYSGNLDRGSYVVSSFLSNHVTLGALSAYILLGERGYAYTQMTLLFNSLLMFGFAYPLAGYYRGLHEQGGSVRVSLKQIFFNRNQMPIVGMAIGIVLNTGGVPRPESMIPVFDSIMHFAAWTFLLPVGHSMDFGEIRTYLRDAVEISFIKCILTPAVAMGIAGFLIQEPTALKTVLVLATQPTAVNAVIAVKLFSLNLHISAAAFVFSTAFYVCIVFPLLSII